MKCPVCKDVELLMSERMGVEIDYCPQCRGIWLDRGELDKLLDKADQGAGAPDQRHGGHGDFNGGERHHKEYRDHDGHGYSSHHSRRRSWLGNLLDFD